MFPNMAMKLKYKIHYFLLKNAIIAFMQSSDNQRSLNLSHSIRLTCKQSTILENWIYHFKTQKINIRKKIHFKSSLHVKNIKKIKEDFQLIFIKTKSLNIK